MYFSSAEHEASHPKKARKGRFCFGFVALWASIEWIRLDQLAARLDIIRLLFPLFPSFFRLRYSPIVSQWALGGTGMRESDVLCDEAVDAAQWAREDVLARHLKPLLELYDLKWRGHGHVYVDHQEHNVLAASMVLAELGIILGVPSAVVRARLMELGWLRDVRDTQPNPNEVKRVELSHRFSSDREVDYSECDEEFDEG